MPQFLRHLQPTSFACALDMDIWTPSQRVPGCSARRLRPATWTPILPLNFPQHIPASRNSCLAQAQALLKSPGPLIHLTFCGAQIQVSQRPAIAAARFRLQSLEKTVQKLLKPKYAKMIFQVSRCCWLVDCCCWFQLISEPKVSNFGPWRRKELIRSFRFPARTFPSSTAALPLDCTNSFTTLRSSKSTS